MPIRNLTFVLVVATLALTGCIDATPETFGRSCETDANCGDGLVCRPADMGPTCTLPCRTDADCPISIDFHCGELVTCQEGLCAYWPCA